MYSAKLGINQVPVILKDGLLDDEETSGVNYLSDAQHRCDYLNEIKRKKESKMKNEIITDPVEIEKIFKEDQKQVDELLEKSSPSSYATAIADPVFGIRFENKRFKTQKEIQIDKVVALLDKWDGEANIDKATMLQEEGLLADYSQVSV